MQNVEVTSTSQFHNNQTDIEHGSTASPLMAEAEELLNKKRLITEKERIYLIANRLHATKVYTFFYFFMILLNTGLLISISVDREAGDKVFFVISEVVITLFLLFEVVLKLSILKRDYWNDYSNWFDFFVLLLCVISIFLFAEFKISKLSKKPIPVEFENVLITSMLVLRYITQLLRLIALLKQRKQMEIIKAGMNHKLDDIDFNAIENEVDYSIFSNLNCDRPRTLSQLRSSLSQSMHSPTDSGSDSAGESGGLSESTRGEACQQGIKPETVVAMTQEKIDHPGHGIDINVEANKSEESEKLCETKPMARTVPTTTRSLQIT